jgi:hypothetical protein
MFPQIPKWRIYAYGVALVAVISYAVWSIWGVGPQTPQQGFQSTKPAVKEPKVDGPTVKLKVLPKEAVKRKLPTARIADNEEVIDTAIVPDAPHGAKTITTIDPTGEAHTEVQINAAPWFELRRNNAIEIWGEMGSEGKRISGDYIRDVAAIKGNTIKLKAGGKAPLEPAGKLEWHLGAGINIPF